MQNNRLSLPPLIRNENFDPSHNTAFPKWNKNIINNDFATTQDRKFTKIKGIKYGLSSTKNHRSPIQLKSLSDSNFTSASYRSRKKVKNNVLLRESIVPPPIVQIESGCVKRSKRSYKKRSRKESSIRQKKLKTKAATCIQKFIRGVLARILFYLLQRRLLFRLAAKSGVLLACSNTIQGESGWYQQNETSAPVYYEVNKFGEWKLIM